MQDDGQKPADELEPVPLEHGPHERRISPEVPVRPCLGRADAERPHLGEDAIRRKLKAPPRNLADAPGDRARRQSLEYR